MTAGRTVDLVVLGGGVIGLAVARAIKTRHPEWRLAVLDEPTRAGSASHAAAGMLAPYSEFSEVSPLGRLCTESLGLYPAFLAELSADNPGSPVDVRWDGTLVPFEPGLETRAARKLDALTARGAPVRVLDGTELRKAEPTLSIAIDRAIWLPEGVLNPRQLHAALHADCWRRGVAIFADSAESILATERDGRKEAGGVVLASGEIIRAGRLVAATGAWGNEVARLLAIDLDVVPVKGQMARLLAPDGFVRHVIHGAEVYLAPRPGLGLIVGSSMEQIGFDTAVDPATIAGFRRRAAGLVPAVEAMLLVESWAGLRPRTADGLPVIGWEPGWTNVFLATGHFRNGILLTPKTAEMVARMIDGEGSETWDCFSPKRLRN